jgi:hypothetical protein
MCVKINKRVRIDKQIRRNHYGRRRDQSLFDTDLTVLQDGERVSFAKRLQIHGV